MAVKERGGGGDARETALVDGPAGRGGPSSRDTVFCHFPHVGVDRLGPATYVRQGDCKLIRRFCDGENQADRWAAGKDAALDLVGAKATVTSATNRPTLHLLQTPNRLDTATSIDDDLPRSPRFLACQSS
jgi:hypothetical protein